MNHSFGGIGAPTTDAIVNIALRFVDTTDPLATVGAGVVFQRGSFFADLGYRFSRIFARDGVAGLLAGGNLDVNQVRVALGVRF